MAYNVTSIWEKGAVLVRTPEVWLQINKKVWGIRENRAGSKLAKVGQIPRRTNRQERKSLGEKKRTSFSVFQKKKVGSPVQDLSLRTLRGTDSSSLDSFRTL